jgi:pimeloyl-ACP methyl ester carboxylesterase
LTATADVEWAFRADDDAVLKALADGNHRSSLRDYFGAAAYAELSLLAAAAKKSPKPAGPRVLVLPGIMGSKLGDRKSGVLWIDPLKIAAGRLTALSLPHAAEVRAMGVLLFTYAKLKLQLSIHGYDAYFHPYDWRLGLDELGAQLAARIAAADKPVNLVAHSMGGLVARAAVRMLPRRLVRKLIMLGTPNGGSFASVQTLRAAYPFMRKMATLDRRHSAEYLAAKIFGTFPGLYHMLPATRRSGRVNLLDPAAWPQDGLKPNAELLGQVAAARKCLAPVDARMVQVIGVNQETVVGVRRTPAGFEYAMSRNGDGTVALSSARQAKLKSYFVAELHGNLANNVQVIHAVLDLLRSGRTHDLPAHWRARRGLVRRVDDRRLRTESRAKIDWRALTAAQRDAILAELDSSRVPARAPSRALR